MIILIAHKLTPGRDYSALFTAIKSAPATSWSHYIDDLWLVKTNETPKQMNERISPFINQGADTMLIVKLDASDYSGWLPSAAHAWIKANR